LEQFLWQCFISGHQDVGFILNTQCCSLTHRKKIGMYPPGLIVVGKLFYGL